MRTKSLFAETIASWFVKNQRDLPWRKTSDPYQIWISEIMLQQTTVATVIDYYNRFIKKFPNVEALAAAKEDEVLKLWEGLGYYRRARNLHAAAKMIVSELNGRFPDTRDDVLKLPGVGEYTAGAILSIAFRKSEAALDGNLIRVYSRLYRFQDDVTLSTSLKQLWSWAREHSPKSAEISREFAEGMMELGATICTPKNPQCGLCPVSERCEGLTAGDADLYPRKLKKEKRFKLYEEVLLLRKKSKIAFLTKGADPKFPLFLRLPYRSLDSEPETFTWKTKYSVTNRDFNVYVNETGDFADKRNLKWLTRVQLRKALLSAVDRKIIEKFSLNPKYQETSG